MNAGRLVRVTMGCLCAHRPAAVDLTSGPSFTVADSPCLGCTVSKADIIHQVIAPDQDADWHNRADFKQHTETPLSIAADKDLFPRLEQTRVDGSKKKQRAYTRNRKNEVTAEP